MQYSTLYFIIITCFLLTTASWITLNKVYHDNIKHSLRLFVHVSVELVMSSVAYFALFFVLTLVVAGAIYLILLLLIYVPSDFMRNYFGFDGLTKALGSLMPVIQSNPSSPGITGIPLLDYFSLLSFLLGPACGAKCIIGQYPPLKTVHDTH